MPRVNKNAEEFTNLRLGSPVEVQNHRGVFVPGIVVGLRAFFVNQKMRIRVLVRTARNTELLVSEDKVFLII
jgi:hypothetical protein